jgi:hypothetical protein
VPFNVAAKSEREANNLFPPLVPGVVNCREKAVEMFINGGREKQSRKEY